MKSPLQLNFWHLKTCVTYIWNKFWNVFIFNYFFSVFQFFFHLLVSPVSQIKLPMFIFLHSLTSFSHVILYCMVHQSTDIVVNRQCMFLLSASISNIYCWYSRTSTFTWHLFTNCTKPCVAWFSYTVFIINNCWAAD